MMDEKKDGKTSELKNAKLEAVEAWEEYERTREELIEEICAFKIPKYMHKYLDPEGL